MFKKENQFSTVWTTTEWPNKHNVVDVYDRDIFPPIANFAVPFCQDTDEQLEDLDEEVQITPIVVKLAGAIRNTMALMFVCQDNF
ncbi:hypothetical protein GCK72_025957 [Caenorhabditis remanei]|uniref:Uncharacterized protein n=1 Tax=Caenorhabditis remanei TaxID=31234 RepID=A0A6A5G4S9_CAERE|nr:hypothetical protein GCK72_025957 [Caenorhabditis remanei]KAF1749489.1 hypothetical protein GCK72_025957 [Caenorhabditis remanei]